MGKGYLQIVLNARKYKNLDTTSLLLSSSSFTIAPLRQIHPSSHNFVEFSPDANYFIDRPRVSLHRHRPAAPIVSRVLNFRVSLNIQQKDLSEKRGVPPPTLQKYIKNAVIPQNSLMCHQPLPWP